ncbi:MAG TPA: G5 domain-containing protein [Actinoplanes sp.]|nr:G5 domain-containing protein [Actinoplanes sp.]
MTAGASAVLVAIGGGSATIATLTRDEPRIVTVTGQNAEAAAPVPPPQRPAGTTTPPSAAESRLGGPADLVPDLAAQPVGERAWRRTSEEADRTATRAPRATTAAPVPAVPVPARRRPTVTSRMVVETREIPYRTRLIRDPDLPRGRKRVQTEGVAGEQTLRWLVTYSDGRPTDRRLVDAVVTKQPQHRVVAFGTRRSQGDRECRSGSDHCFPAGRSATCPDMDMPTEAAAREITVVCE